MFKNKPINLLYDSFFFESLNDGTGYHTDKRGLHYAKTVVVGTCRYLSVTQLIFLQAAEFNG